MNDTNRIEQLRHIRATLKSGDYDGVDVMQAWIALDEYITALSARASAGEGGEWVMVPREATHAMIAAALHEDGNPALLVSETTRFRRGYAAMLAAAPESPK